MFNEINDLMNEMSKALFGEEISSVELKNTIAINLADAKEGYTLEANLPGVAKENVKLSYKDDIFTIEVADKKASNKEGYILNERMNGFYPRSVMLKNIDFTKAQAKLADGVLKVYLPKNVNEKKYITIE